MDRDATGFVPRKGMRVIDVDGENVGEIDLVEPATFIVRKGLFPQDHYIPLSAIASHDDDAVYLDISGHEALERGLWNPTVAFPDAGSGAPAAGVLPEDQVEAPALDEDLAASLEPESVPADDLAIPGSDEAITEADVEDHAGERHQTVELHAEEITATTRPVERGIARVEKRVVEERQTFEVPVVEEEVIVTRRRVDREISDADRPFEEEHVELRLRGQEVEIETRAQVVEEIDVGKTAHEHIREVTDTVRHEEARIEGDVIDVDASDDVTDLPDERTQRGPD